MDVLYLCITILMTVLWFGFILLICLGLMLLLKWLSLPSWANEILAYLIFPVALGIACWIGYWAVTFRENKIRQD